MEKVIFFLLLLGCTPLFAQDDDLTALELAVQEDTYRPQRTTPSRVSKKADNIETVGRNLDLRSVLEEGFRKNPFEQIRTQRKEQIELSKTDVWQKFWLPSISLEMQTSNHQIDRFTESTQSTPSMGAQKAPTGSLGLVLGEYTLFNWGRDYLEYQNQKQSLGRENQKLNESRRRLRFSLITQYFNLVKAKEVRKIHQEQLRQTAFIHRLAKEKLQLRKIKAQEYYQTRSEYLKAQTDYQGSLFDVGIQEEEVANLLGDEYQTGYRTLEQLKYVSVNAPIEEALKFSQEQSAEYKDAKLLLENSSRSYEKSLKDNMPLPKFSLNLGTYKSGFDQNGTNWNYETTPGNKNLELVASIDMKWTILGAGGFFNSRNNQQYYLNKRIAEINFFNTKRALEVKIRTIYKNLRYMEQKVEIAEFQHKNAQKNYDSVLDNYIAGNTTYSDIKFAVDNLVSSHINSQNVKYDHLIKKLELADFMGLEDLPGENFEQLAQR